MFLDFRKPETPSSFEVDVCIIGSGPAGISLARSLLQTGARIAIVESGGYEPEADTQALYEGELANDQHTALDACRLRYLGGSSNCWNGWCSPLDPIDFEERDWVPGSGWPIGFDDLMPYYEAAQTVCEIGPFGYDEQMWEKLAPKREDFDSTRIRTPFWQYSPPTRFGQRYRYELANAPNLISLLHANAVEFETTTDADHVTELQIASLNGKTGTVRAKKFVVACGGLENPRLLLASNSQKSTGLGNDFDQVGRYFMEHPYAISAYVVSKMTDHLPTVEKTLNDVRYETVYCTGYEAQREHRVMNSMALHWMNEDVDHLFQWGRGELPQVPAGHVSYSLMTQSEQTPNANSRITLSTQMDPFGKPKAKLDWRFLPIDKQTVRVQMELVGAELARLNLGRLKLADWLLDDGAYWGMGGGNHHMGTTRMGDDPKTSVVDKDCKVHGLDNLYIAGSSVFTTSGWANPTLTIVALALRLGEHLEADLTKQG